MTNETVYTKKSESGRHLRVQLLATPEGTLISHAEEVGKGPDDLRGYQGGWELFRDVYRRRANAERLLKRNGWAPVEAPTAVEVWLPTLRKDAPSNAAGIRGTGTPYSTRARALRHQHWNNQAPWGTCYRAVLLDGNAHVAGTPESTVSDNLSGLTVSPIAADQEIAKLAEEGKLAAAVLAYWKRYEK